MKTNSKNNCFIIMPITTPDYLVGKYGGDEKHFTNVMNNLFIPAIKAIDYEPVLPKTLGSYVIQADIIKKIEDADLVLCDMSALNPNVFFELGIRTALNRPVSLVTDDLTEKIPFDTSIVNYHSYKSIPTWDVENEIENLKKHLLASIDSSSGQNTMWGKFGISLAVGQPPSSPLESKVDLLFDKMDSISRIFSSQVTNSASLAPNYIESASTQKKYQEEKFLETIIESYLRNNGLHLIDLHILPKVRTIRINIREGILSATQLKDIRRFLESVGSDYDVKN